MDRKNYLKIAALLIFLLFAQVLMNSQDLEAQAYTAKHYCKAADSLIANYTKTGSLLSLSCDSVSLDGKADNWQFSYADYAGNARTSYFFHTSGGMVFLDSTYADIPIGVMRILFPWVDSDSALIVSELTGGALFRKRHPLCKIRASLSQPLIPNSIPYWYITYTALGNSLETQYFNVPAEDSAAINAIHDPQPGNAGGFNLYHNYPNPFNPETKITFTLPFGGRTEVIVYNLNGERVAELLNKELSAGSHSVVWNGKNCPSGIYLYVVKTGNSQRIGKMALMK